MLAPEVSGAECAKVADYTVKGTQLLAFRSGRVTQVCRLRNVSPEAPSAPFGAPSAPFGAPSAPGATLFSMGATSMLYLYHSLRLGILKSEIFEKF